MTRFASVLRRPVALWTVTALLLGTFIGFSAFGHGAPAVAFQQAGHWVYNSPLGAVFRVDGGGKNVDAEVSGVQAEPGSPVLQGKANGYVVGSDQVVVFGKSDLTVKNTIRTGIPEQPLGIEAPGGPYLVYRQHGQIVRLGDSQETIAVGSTVSSAIATPDGTLWLRGADHFCRLAASSTELDCALRAPVGDAGALLSMAGKPAFVNLTKQTLTQLTGDAAGRALALAADTSLPTTSVVAQSDVGGRVPILAGDRLLLVAAGGGKPTITVALNPGKYDALAATGSAIAVLDTNHRVLRTFDADGKAVRTHNLAPTKSKATTKPRATAGEDGRIYIDDDAGAVVTVVDGDGSVSEVKTDGSNRPTSPSAQPTSTTQPTSKPTTTPTTTPTPSSKPTLLPPIRVRPRLTVGPKPGRTTQPESTPSTETKPPSKPTPRPTPKPTPKPTPRPTPKPTPTPTPKPTPPPASAPGAPGSVTVKRGDGKGTVTWAVARNNGAAITKYTVRFRLAPGSYVIGLPAEGSMEVAGTKRSATFTQLFDMVSYIFTVSATNKVGTGPAVDKLAKPPERQQGQGWPTGGGAPSGPPPGAVPQAGGRRLRKDPVW